MADKVQSSIETPDEHKKGTFASAVRLVHDSGTEWFLDFLVLENQEMVVVSRIRVHEAFLSAIRDRLDSTVGHQKISDLPSTGAVQ